MSNVLRAYARHVSIPVEGEKGCLPLPPGSFGPGPPRPSKSALAGFGVVFGPPAVGRTHQTGNSSTVCAADVTVTDCATPAALAPTPRKLSEPMSGLP